MKHVLCFFIAILMASCATQHLSSQQETDLKHLKPHYAAIQNGRIEYYRFGHGSPIVLIPGYVTDITSWDKRFLATLAESHQVIVFNNRNVGGSYVKAEHYDSKDLAKDTCQLIQKLHLKKPSVLGVSMGGMIAQQFAVLYPNKLSHLILINTAIAGNQAVRPTAATEKLMLNMPTSKLGRYKVALQLFFPPSERAQMGLALALNRFLPKNYTEIDAAAVMSDQRQLILKWTNDNVTAQKITQLNLPVLILNGKADSVIPPANSLILAKTIPHAKLKRWKAGGHAMIYQFPKSVAVAINDFIKE